MNLMGEANADLVEDVEDRGPPVSEVLVTVVDHRRRGRRKHRDHFPDLAAREANDSLHAELRRRAGCVLHLLCCAPAHALWVAVAPDPGRHDSLVPVVDRIVAYRLADEM